MNIDNEENPECSDHISERDLLRSISYHESWHTALARITRRHVLQIIDSRLRIFWYEALSIIPHQLTPILFWKFTSKERIFHLLVWFAMQWVLEKNKKHKLWEDKVELHWNKSTNQPDITKSLKILRKKYTFKKEEDEKKMIKEIIKRIQVFLENQPKLKKFIARLAYLNQRQGLLLPEHIRYAEKYAWIDLDEKKRLREQINKLDID